MKKETKAELKENLENPVLCLTDHRDEFDKRMCKTYPKMFKNRFQPMSETCMCWGFSIGPGWYKIVEETCAKLQLLSDVFGLQAVAAQIKEKFGTLRFYFDIEQGDIVAINKADRAMAGDIMYDVVTRAEEETAWTCEECGERGKTRGTGWLVTLCDKHWAERQKKHGIKAIEPKKSEIATPTAEDCKHQPKKAFMSKLANDELNKGTKAKK